MIQPASLEELASLVEKAGKKVFEIGRFVNRDRKSKEQINDFLAGLK